MENAIIIYSDSSRGIYIPQFFNESVRREFIAHNDGSTLEAFDALAKGPESEFYWDEWETVLDNLTVRHNGREYELYQDSDLFLIDFENATDDELKNLGFEF